MLYLVKFTLIAVFFVNVNLTTAASSASQELDLDKITIKPLKTVDPAIFIDFFVETFLEAYKPFSLEVLGKTAYEGKGGKKNWLTETAEGEIEEARKAPKSAHHLLFYDGEKLVAYMSIHVSPDGTVAYLGQGCIEPAFWGKGGVSHAIDKVVPQYAPKAMQYTLLVRVLNGRAIAAYKKLGFSPDKTGELVIQHDYPKEHYLGMVKDIK